MNDLTPTDARYGHFWIRHRDQDDQIIWVRATTWQEALQRRERAIYIRRQILESLTPSRFDKRARRRVQRLNRWISFFLA